MPKPCTDADITIHPTNDRYVVKSGGTVIADTKNGKLLREGTYPERLYIPRADVVADLLENSSHQSHCPYKGDAAYHHVNVDGQTLENAVWFYDDPCPLVEDVRDHLAFWGDTIEIEKVS